MRDMGDVGHHVALLFEGPLQPSFQLNARLVLILDFSSHRIIISIFNLFISISSSQKFIYAILLSFPDHVLP